MSLSSSKTLSLTWEWAADRAPTGRLLMEVTRIRKEGGGLFGLRKTPSLIDTMPEGHVVTGVVLQGDADVGRPVSLRMPGFEIPDIAAGDRVGLGLIGDETCICMVPVPADLAEEQIEGWLGSFACES
ncbi:hypothetical protein F1188_11730 [Roseospira marina]|uniref:Uncharacterized protein n=1 Tax=Roseospira marina TaxID=140057 RepID=A0A5M6IBW8_9PROT|nr:hypothetical protein [Roseospira marina]KAA5605235.1 hypothetical protein F1188_11730 [Roseospira marina]MBB4314692.1 hypothetical protein [Roseospira marina]MBB5087681.1 hypothetical protein [Roseospira marina]